jgi:hypothetical protein
MGQQAAYVGAEPIVDDGLDHDAQREDEQAEQGTGRPG